jgi:hypothetical protein
MTIFPLDPRLAARRTWTDWLGLCATSTYVCTPADRHELVAMLRATPKLETLRLRVAGSGHSTSGVSVPAPDSFLVAFDRFQVDHAAEAPRWLRSDWYAASTGRIAADASLARVHAGLTVHDLSGMLFYGDPARRRAVLNLGSYDAQTIYGAIATGTHGSGLACGPLADFVVSMEMVVIVKDANGAPEVRSLRVEPTNGVTNRAAFDADAALHQMTLVQDDDLFDSAVVGLGFFGVVTALTLQVVPNFWIEEERYVVPWSTLKYTVVSDAAQWDPYEVTLSAQPLQRNGMWDHQCLVTRRRRVAPGIEPAPGRGDARTEELESRFAKHHRSREELTKSLSSLAAFAPNIGNELVYGHAFEQEADRKPVGGGWKSRSSIVFRQSTGDYTLAASTEIGVPITSTVAAVDAVIRHVADLAQGQYFHSSPFGIRFQRASRHRLSMQHGRDTCTIESPLLKYTRRRWHGEGSAPHDVAYILGQFESALVSAIPGARPHWGQTHSMDRAGVRRAFPAFENVAQPSDPKTWLGQYRTYNPFGIFDNGWSQRMAL